MRYDITGDNLQMLNLEIGPGETIYSVAGAMSYMTGNMSMEAKAKEGAWASIKRSLTGASLFLVQYTSSGTGVVGLANSAPGKIMDIDVSAGAWMVQKTGYLASEEGVVLDLAFQKKFSTMLFGGEGLIIQRLSGSGIAFICGCGDFVVKDLAPGEIIKVSSSHAVAWQDTVSYDISSVGGLKNALFSGEGLFITTMTGPGRVVLQSMTLGDLANALVPYLPQSSSRGEQMEDRGMRTERRGTGRSALGLVGIAVLIVILAAVLAWAFTRPGFLESAANVAALAVVVVVVVIVIAYIAYAVLAVAYYAAKGDVVQTGVDHRLEDVRGVEGRTLDEDGEDLPPRD